jgi:hypothetical protein
MLFVPESHQSRVEPVYDCAQAVYPRVAGGTKRNKMSRLMNSRPAVMHGEFRVRPACLAAASVASEYSVALTGEVAAGVSFAVIAGAAQPRTKQLGAAAGAKEPGLLT